MSSPPRLNPSAVPPMEVDLNAPATDCLAANGDHHDQAHPPPSRSPSPVPRSGGKRRRDDAEPLSDAIDYEFSLHYAFHHPFGCNICRQFRRHVDYDLEHKRRRLTPAWAACDAHLQDLKHSSYATGRADGIRDAQRRYDLALQAAEDNFSARLSSLNQQLASYRSSAAYSAPPRPDLHSHQQHRVRDTTARSIHSAPVWPARAPHATRVSHTHHVPRAPPLPRVDGEWDPLSDDLDDGANTRPIHATGHTSCPPAAVSMVPAAPHPPVTAGHSRGPADPNDLYEQVNGRPLDSASSRLVRAGRATLSAAPFPPARSSANPSGLVPRGALSIPDRRPPATAPSSLPRPPPLSVPKTVLAVDQMIERAHSGDMDALATMKFVSHDAQNTPAVSRTAVQVHIINKWRNPNSAAHRGSSVVAPLPAPRPADADTPLASDPFPTWLAFFQRAPQTLPPGIRQFHDGSPVKQDALAWYVTMRLFPRNSDYARDLRHRFMHLLCATGRFRLVLLEFPHARIVPRIDVCDPVVVDVPITDGNIVLALVHRGFSPTFVEEYLTPYALRLREARERRAANLPPPSAVDDIHLPSASAGLPLIVCVPAAVSNAITTGLPDPVLSTSPTAALPPPPYSSSPPTAVTGISILSTADNEAPTRGPDSTYPSLPPHAFLAPISRASHATPQGPSPASVVTASATSIVTSGDTDMVDDLRSTDVTPLPATLSHSATFSLEASDRDSAMPDADALG
ncbi:hypothetical protein BD410DRAFT_801060 [Rickenella mellea]|uniref:Uncharacterized protein n=1 Tax=Rickenella mellea TaxID=50990 RepID=A0A4Y7QEC1_9AGAM|nr:hypothetical protein BD410DRAFT_801060 [Rickenella mellea]